jgi:hypothetical protein
MNTPSILSAYEGCARKGAWSKDWESNRILPTELIRRGIVAGLTSEREDFQEVCGEEVMQLAADRGLDTDSHNVYDLALHSACLADIICSAIRKPKEAPWTIPDPKVFPSYVWHSGALINPKRRLSRIVLTDYWNSGKKLAAQNSWHSLGEVAAYGLGMDQIVAVLGIHKSDKRHGPFSRCYIHPRSGKIRFQKKSQSTTTDFKESWRRSWREDADISRHDWLSAMHDDGVLAEHLFVVDVPVPEEYKIQELKDLAERKLQTVWNIGQVPDRQLSGCFSPTQCQYVHCCWGKWKEPSEKAGFIPVPSLFQFPVLGS